jgi:hypothetical protein
MRLGIGLENARKSPQRPVHWRLWTFLSLDKKSFPRDPASPNIRKNAMDGGNQPSKAPPVGADSQLLQAACNLQATSEVATVNT